MNHHRNLLVMLASFAILFAGLGSMATTAHAATWHKGTPTAIRGTWRTKTSKSLRTYIHVTSTKYNCDQMYDTKEHAYITDPYRVTNVYYHHKSGSQYYYIKGAHNTEPGTKQVYYVIHKVGNKLREHEYGQSVKGHYTKFNAKYGAWFYKI